MGAARQAARGKCDERHRPGDCTAINGAYWIVQLGSWHAKGRMTHKSSGCLMADLTGSEHDRCNQLKRRNMGSACMVEYRR